jgi:hypothetical protein
MPTSTQHCQEIRKVRVKILFPPFSKARHCSDFHETHACSIAIVNNCYIELKHWIYILNCYIKLLCWIATLKFCTELLYWSAALNLYTELLNWIALLNCYIEFLYWIAILNCYIEFQYWIVILNCYSERLMCAYNHCEECTVTLGSLKMVSADT